MELTETENIVKENISIQSKYLKRLVVVDLFLPPDVEVLNDVNLLLINDGQDMPVMNFRKILEGLYLKQAINPIICVAVSCSNQRMMEYGVAGKADYLGRGAKATMYSKFIIKELLPFLKKKFHKIKFTEIGFAGFSLGGLSALDIVWNNPKVFSIAGIFSGSLWWRSKDQQDVNYQDNKHRIMQQAIRKGQYVSGMKFFFQTGKLDETADRNGNGVIDAVEDTMDHIHELINKGYSPKDIYYLELEDGRHDVPSWGRAMPEFLRWAWGRKTGS